MGCGIVVHSDYVHEIFDSLPISSFTKFCISKMFLPFVVNLHLQEEAQNNQIPLQVDEYAGASNSTKPVQQGTVGKNLSGKTCNQANIYFYINLGISLYGRRTLKCLVKLQPIHSFDAKVPKI